METTSEAQQAAQQAPAEQHKTSELTPEQLAVVNRLSELAAEDQRQREVSASRGAALAAIYQPGLEGFRKVYGTNDQALADRLIQLVAILDAAKQTKLSTGQTKDPLLAEGWSLKELVGQLLPAEQAALTAALDEDFQSQVTFTKARGLGGGMRLSEVHVLGSVISQVRRMVNLMQSSQPTPESNPGPTTSTSSETPPQTAAPVVEPSVAVAGPEQSKQSELRPEQQAVLQHLSELAGDTQADAYGPVIDALKKVYAGNDAALADRLISFVDGLEAAGQAKVASDNLDANLAIVRSLDDLITTLQPQESQVLVDAIHQANTASGKHKGLSPQKAFGDTIFQLHHLLNSGDAQLVDETNGVDHSPEQNLSLEDRKKLGQFISQNMSYLDLETMATDPASGVVLTDIDRQALAHERAKLEAGDFVGDESRFAYSLQLQEQLADPNKKQAFDQLVESLHGQYETLVKNLNIQDSIWGKSRGWAKWDIAKQDYFNQHSAALSDKYQGRQGDPYTDAAKQQEIVDRHLGWEVYGDRYAYLDGRVRLSPQAENHPLHGRLLELLKQPSKQDLVYAEQHQLAEAEGLDQEAAHQKASEYLAEHKIADDPGAAELAEIGALLRSMTQEVQPVASPPSPAEEQPAGTNHPSDYERRQHHQPEFPNADPRASRYIQELTGMSPREFGSSPADSNPARVRVRQAGEHARAEFMRINGERPDLTVGLGLDTDRLGLRLPVVAIAFRWSGWARKVGEWAGRLRGRAPQPTIQTFEQQAYAAHEAQLRATEAERQVRLARLSNLNQWADSLARNIPYFYGRFPQLAPTIEKYRSLVDLDQVSQIRDQLTARKYGLEQIWQTLAEYKVAMQAIPDLENQVRSFVAEANDLTPTQPEAALTRDRLITYLNSRQEVITAHSTWRKLERPPSANNQLAADHEPTTIVETDPLPEEAPRPEVAQEESPLTLDQAQDVIIRRFVRPEDDSRYETVVGQPVNFTVQVDSESYQRWQNDPNHLQLTKLMTAQPTDPEFKRYATEKLQTAIPLLESVVSKFAESGADAQTDQRYAIARSFLTDYKRAATALNIEVNENLAVTSKPRARRSGGFKRSTQAVPGQLAA